MFLASPGGLGRPLSLIVGGVWLCGCAPLPVEQHNELSELREEVTTISEQLASTRRELALAEGHQQSASVTLSEQLAILAAELEALPDDLEQVYIDPPGQLTVARIDTGAESSSIHAEDIIEFERDGEDWVRFNVILDDVVSEIERRVVRYVRVYQQADPDGTRRAVVRLRVRMGNFEDSFEFTLFVQPTPSQD